MLNLRWSVGALVCGSMLLGAGSIMHPVEAQPAPSQGAAFKVAVINIEKVIADYKKFKDAKDLFRKDLEAKDKELKGMDEKADAKIKILQSGQIKNAQDREALEREINEIKFESAKIKRKAAQDFAIREAEMFQTIYKDITNLVKIYCEEQKIYLVIRLQDGQANVNNPESVIKAVMGNVVYHHPYIDLTKTISDGLN